MRKVEANSMVKMRKESDVLGTVEVPDDAYFGINTQRAIRNFSISGRRMPIAFIVALAQVKKACLLSNIEHGEIENEIGEALLTSVDEILHHEKFFDQFPVDVFQTGS
ncbi:MAG: lyase family protein, partial [Candidatus Thorarchaeota archaeon]